MMFGERKIFRNRSFSNDNEQIIKWTLEILDVMENAGPALSINSCTVQVLAGNKVQIQIQDWYEDFIPRFGTEHGLEKFFELVPVSGTSDIYVTKISPHILGSSKQFINCLEDVLKKKQINGYQRDVRFECLHKCFHN